MFKYCLFAHILNYYFRLQSHWFWLGMQKPQDLCDADDFQCPMTGWSWLDGTLYDHNVYHQWYHKCLNSLDGCIAMAAHGWEDKSCYTKLPYICEKGGYSGIS